MARLARREKASIWTLLLSGATPEASFMTECISELPWGPLGPAAAPGPQPHRELQAGMRGSDADILVVGNHIANMFCRHLTWCHRGLTVAVLWPPPYKSNCSFLPAPVFQYSSSWNTLRRHIRPKSAQQRNLCNQSIDRLSIIVCVQQMSNMPSLEAAAEGAAILSSQEVTAICATRVWLQQVWQQPHKILICCFYICL